MKFKRIVALCCAFSLFTSMAVLGAAVRQDPLKKSKKIDRTQSNDIIFQDFTSVDEGLIPSGITVSGSGGDVLTQEEEVLSGYRKNVLILNDTTVDENGTGAVINYGLGKRNGMAGLEIRFKFRSDADYNSTEIALKNQSGIIISRYNMISDGSGSLLNSGGGGSTLLEAGHLKKDHWFVLKWVMDFDANKMDFLIVDETAGTNKLVKDAAFFNSGTMGDISSINWSTGRYGGQYVIDYIRLTKETERLTEVEGPDPYANIKKGTEAEKVAGPTGRLLTDRINVKVNGVYKYATKTPYLNENGDVMVTAKNIAGFLNAKYVRKNNEYMIKTEDEVLVVDMKNSKVTLNGADAVMTDIKEEENQLFVPIKQFCDLLGYTCELSEDSLLVNIFTVDIQEEGGNINDAE